MGVLTGPAVGRRLGVGRLHGTVLMISLAAIPATTLTPGGDVPGPGSQIGTCDFCRLGLASVQDLLTINEVSLNILLFVPIGWPSGSCRAHGSRSLPAPGLRLFPSPSRRSSW